MFIACGWVLYDQEDRSSFLPDLMSDIIFELIPSDTLIVDGLEDHPFLIEAHAKSIQYEALPLRYTNIQFTTRKSDHFNHYIYLLLMFLPGEKSITGKIIAKARAGPNGLN